MDNLVACFLLRDLGFRPYHPAKNVISGSHNTDLEFISYPFPTETGKICIMVREKDRPETMKQAEIPIWAKDYIHGYISI